MTQRDQRRGRSIAMTERERDAFLRTERTCRVATLSELGPHNAPLWFWWDGSHLWLNSVVASQRWRDIERDPRIAVVVDAGEDYADLRGVQVQGSAVPQGEVPRTGGPARSDLLAAEQGFHDKYRGGKGPVTHDGKHAWLRVEAVKVTSWDFRKRNVPATPGPEHG